MATDYSKTVHLPVTQLPMKANLPQREPASQKLWEEKDIYRKMLESKAAAPEYVLHDGPPYANGHIHIGHALNKILKDMVVKTRALTGRKSPIVFGWDCHGLPIESALLKEMKIDKRGVKDIPDFRAKAEEFAAKFIDIQRLEFKRLGILGEWDRPYVTMSREYEARVLRAFRQLLGKGYIYRGMKTVSWCVTCETALAEAEVEYKDKSSPSLYVALPVREIKKDVGFPFVDKRVRVLIWTTTPWTLPANRAIAFHPDGIEYGLLEIEKHLFLVATPMMEQVVSAVAKTMGRTPNHRTIGIEQGHKTSWLGRELVGAGLICETPFAYINGFKFKESPAVLADYVTAVDGTGIVHTAPGHGIDDFETGKKHGLEILCPVDHSGRFTAEAGPLFEGKQIFKEGNPAVIEELKSSGRLLASGAVTHSYPHCWRCKSPIAFRATEQWFLDVNHEGLREKLLRAIDAVQWIPEAGKERISSMVQNRPDWCLSRQRVWGTPIPILYCASCNEPVKDDEVLKAVEDRVARNGDAFWFEDSGKQVRLCASDAPEGSPASDEVLTWSFMPREVGCPKCQGEFFRRETDILDVWVDSGASWLAVLADENQYPCDLYLEGSDQHRGWFQSSLVLSVALTGKAPYKTVLTHGFVLDDQGRAMHKSLGNVVSPRQVIEKYGADVLRLWVALADYSDDVRLSDKLLEGPTEAYRKIRNTLRYLLGNIFDFDPAKNSLDIRKMADLDRYLLHRLAETTRQVTGAYEDFRFRSAARVLTDFCNLDLSSFYLDACKDRLYTMAADAPARRGAQTVLFEILRRLLPLTAPILSFTAEEAWIEFKRILGSLGSTYSLPESVFLSQTPETPSDWMDFALEERWKIVLDIRARVNRAIETARAQGLLGGSLQAKVRLMGSAAAEKPILETYRDLWPEILLVSQTEIDPNGGELKIEVYKADGTKCARCWRYQVDVGSDPSQPELCARCVRQN